MSHKKRDQTRRNLGISLGIALAVSLVGVGSLPTLRGAVKPYNCAQSPEVTGSRWQNPKLPLDINNDGLRTEADANILLADLNRTATNKLWRRHPEPKTPPFIDPTGDSHTSPADALAVINHLNNCGEDAATGESAASFSHHNEKKPADVNNDGSIAPIDVLILINEINANGSHKLDPSVSNPKFFLDVKPDGWVSPADLNAASAALNAQ